MAAAPVIDKPFSFMDFLLDPNIWVAFFMLTALEIVLGIDNIVFISVLVGRLPAHMRDHARKIGLAMAMIFRILLLFSLSWIMGLTADLFQVAGQGISGRDLVLLLGGLFVGYGARLGGGCASGHGICGIGSFHLPSVVAVLTFMATGLLTANLITRWF